MRNGVTITTPRQRRRRGRHTAPPSLLRASLTGLRVYTAIFLWLLGCCARDAIAWVWRKLGPCGRLVAAMTGIWPLTHLARMAALIGERGSWAVSISVTILCWVSLGLIQARGRRRAERQQEDGQQEWREKRGRGGKLAGPGWQADYEPQAARREAMITENREWLEEHQRRIAALSRALAGAYSAAGLPAPEDLSPVRHLHAVPDDDVLSSLCPVACPALTAAHPLDQLHGTALLGAG